MLAAAPLWLLLLLGGTSALTSNQKRKIVEKHNNYRSQPDPPAADMKRLTWDPTLEELATSYAAKCIWDHNAERGFRGENLFIMSGSSLDVELGMDDWHQERDFYNFTANSCQEGEMCGHYTQMVWAGTERVGCGEKFCETVEGFEEGNMYLLVCNYEPPGNFKGEQPFSVGPACSACPDTHPCQGSLCVDPEQKESGTEIPDTVSEQTPASEPALDATVWIEGETYATVMLQPYVITEKPKGDATTSPPPTSTTTPERSISPSTSTVPPETSTSPSTSTTMSTVPPETSTSTTMSTVPPETSTPPSTSTTMSTVPPETSTSPSTSTTMSTVPPETSTSTTMSTVLPEMSASPSTSAIPPDTSQSEQVLDVTPTGVGSSAIGFPKTLEDSSPKIEGQRVGDDTSPAVISPTTSQTVGRVLTTPSKTEQPSSSPEAPGDKTFSNDGPDTPGNLSSPPEKEVATPVDKDQSKDAPNYPPTKVTTLKSLILPTTPSAKRKKGQKDGVKQPQDTRPKTDGKSTKEKQKSKQKSNHAFLFKKYQMSSNALPNGGRWGSKASASDGTYFGNQFYSPPIGQTHRPSCPYPCLTSSFQFPLYRANNPSPSRGQHHQAWWPANKPNGKKPCKQDTGYGYKSAVYSLYRPSNAIDENLPEPKRRRRFWR